ncbi:MAG: capsule assembly Wzi family protein [Bacteroidota bacterium]|nr:capsule assembly Wzi family protein [Bacteroidota bacterium]
MGIKTILLIIYFLIVGTTQKSNCQVENVPIHNQVYEFLDRMGVKGILPFYSNTMIPLSRQEVAELLQKIDAQRVILNAVEMEYLDKFKQEFMHEIDPLNENATILFKSRSLQDMVSNKEKYLYNYVDSSVTFYAEFLGDFQHRRTGGGTYGSTNCSFEEHGGRLRGTVKERLGYYLQATNGTFFGNRALGLLDRRFQGNVKFRDLKTNNFDFTEAYLRADLNWFNLQFGREKSLLGTGYSDRLMLSTNAPVFDFLKMDFRYKSFRFLFLHGSVVWDSVDHRVKDKNKYLALHRGQFSLFDFMNVGVSEMVIYQRVSPDFAYLNPINFYKSSEHSLQDRDNAILNFDIEIFPFNNYKFYGMWLIDDIDFSKMGTGWWGNEFGWQGGMYLAEIAGTPNLDLVLEYTRIEPYVYSNRLEGNSYTHNSIGLGHYLEPNSDEWFIQLRYFPHKQIRAWFTYRQVRHGENVIREDTIKNVGGSALLGHRGNDPDNVRFLDGNLAGTNRYQIRFSYEPILNLFLIGVCEYQKEKKYWLASTGKDFYFSLQLKMEY